MAAMKVLRSRGIVTQTVSAGRGCLVNDDLRAKREGGEVVGEGTCRNDHWGGRAGQLDEWEGGQWKIQPMVWRRTVPRHPRTSK
jgi:hypothetical protein